MIRPALYHCKARKTKNRPESHPSSLHPKLAKAILIHFGSVDNFAKSTERELKEVPGMGPKRAKLIHSVLSSQYDSGNDSFE